MRYQWPSNELEAGVPNHVQYIRGVIFNARSHRDMRNRVVSCKFPLRNNSDHLFGIISFVGGRGLQKDCTITLKKED